jgi:hypothetical protein
LKLKLFSRPGWKPFELFTHKFGLFCYVDFCSVGLYHQLMSDTKLLQAILDALEKRVAKLENQVVNN